MRGWLVAALMAVLALGPAGAQERDPAIPGVIQSQIDAFLADDFVTAFTFASPNIKRLFGNPDRFGTMVRQGYPMVWRPADVQFLEQETKGGAIHQKVLITDAEGVPHVLDYQMIPTPEGWQINGVVLLVAPPVGA
ncbi:DUF4864 domain-containing protein [Ovoidimarina sediminis]|uniref:DUF4864 domain-containing protein n=1 Tax=Ovoidimarina sediminis TaxID=3079856 RepID=UPI002911F705|nr:DUF4864 domain-containing protein [Rhodophyticola sp. MJ-SS7]MDU8943462.1 DUF4864 domain-containing protein [Rhodophyticola sp. MJ-SS7]